jgi:hypothetical protein
MGRGISDSKFGVAGPAEPNVTDDSAILPVGCNKETARHSKPECAAGRFKLYRTSSIPVDFQGRILLESECSDPTEYGLKINPHRYRNSTTCKQIVSECAKLRGDIGVKCYSGAWVIAARRKTER